MTHRSGNFDLMRLLAAWTVLWSHQHTLNGYTEPGIPIAGVVGTIGVIAFFAISGYLNAQSLYRSRSAVSFLTNRAFRIFPALVVCVVFCIVLGAFVTTHDLRSYLAPQDGMLSRNSPLMYLWRNSTLLLGLRFELPGVFEANAYPKVVNGSLWTLPLEVRLYLILAVFAFCCRYKPVLSTVILSAGLAGLLLSGFVWPLGPILQNQYLATYGAVFAAGVVLALLQAQLGLIPALAALSLLSVCFFIQGSLSLGLSLAVVVGCIVLNNVSLPSWLSPKLDISYGSYLYAFPVQQLTANWSDSFWVRLFICFLLSTLLGYLSAKFIEQPAIRMGKKVTTVRRANVHASAAQTAA